MALCESQLDSALSLQGEMDGNSPDSEQVSETTPPTMQTNGDIYPPVPGGLPLSVDYRSPVSHFVPPAVEMYAARKSEPITSTPAMMNRGEGTPGEKRKRGRPRVDKTSPEYLARKRARELEALERKAKREYRRRNTGDSAASSSAGETTPRVKRKYTKRAPSAKKNDTPGAEKVKGKRGRPRKSDQLAAQREQQQPTIRVRSNLMPSNNETITLDSDDEPDLGSPSQASDSLSLDENLRALRHIHEKYANIDKDDLYEAHLLAANFKKPTPDQRLRDDDEVLSIRSSEGNASVKDSETRVEKLEDSSNSDSDSSSSGSGSSSSGSSSSSSGSSSSDSSDSDSDSEGGRPAPAPAPAPPAPPAPPADTHEDDSRSFGAWSYSGPQSDSGSESDPERCGEPPGARGDHDEISESENESADKNFQCHICRKWYSTKVTLKIHRRSHQSRGGGGGGGGGGGTRARARAGDRYECDCCSETFTRREKLWEHRAEAHRGSMTVRCEVCRKCFEDDAELSAHSATHTADERAGRCSECGASFQRFEQLRRHRAAAHGVGPVSALGGLPHACATCGKRFGHAHSLTRHMHNHAKQLYRCVVCKASFARADQLAQHLNSHLANYKRLKP